MHVAIRHEALCPYALREPEPFNRTCNCILLYVAPLRLRAEFLCCFALMLAELGFNLSSSVALRATSCKHISVACEQQNYTNGMEIRNVNIALKDTRDNRWSI
jgi:hypothetical protein